MGKRKQSWGYRDGQLGLFGDPEETSKREEYVPRELSQEERNYVYQLPAGSPSVKDYYAKLIPPGTEIQSVLEVYDKANPSLSGIVLWYETHKPDAFDKMMLVYSLEQCINPALMGVKVAYLKTCPVKRTSENYYWHQLVPYCSLEKKEFYLLLPDRVKAKEGWKDLIEIEFPPKLD